MLLREVYIMKHHRWGKLGAQCDIETAKMAYDIIREAYRRLEEENERLEQALRAKETEIQQLKEKDRENGRQLWDFVRYLAQFDSVSFSDETEKNSFEYFYQHTK